MAVEQMVGASESESEEEEILQEPSESAEGGRAQDDSQDISLHVSEESKTGEGSVEQVKLEEVNKEEEKAEQEEDGNEAKMDGHKDVRDFDLATLSQERQQEASAEKQTGTVGNMAGMDVAGNHESEAGAREEEGQDEPGGAP